ncbi:type III-B CRISPR module RAMP protein Cmr4 [Geobacillus subterraneus]|uniref:Type III-B CRISPR module RAMP protein Cmr4 n=2 Tax=Geobacillus TaxID=129337 RepID=A0ABM6AEA7_9BACL|nr:MULTISPECIES: type III-B CRISPR module RAMP protein Cmr4 [Geobacillus]AMX84692.1 type III-B CRISPR module RAMP protein Cmr4 [Geobacillus subterraneus]KZS25691.1 type III-B CRISPR module RAMP protein Cmr4 [Geobacillus subterraneus]OXB85514.1 type III-B CRISPR module RAMP protein Cmr4 [Geobacillus uzenensis]
MYSIVRPFVLHAVTSVHAGSGSEIGLVDLPIQREKHTGFPKIESSSLKGAVRYHMVQALPEEKKELDLIFGADRGEESVTQASAIALSDARVLLFPVKSLRGVFAWITCPHVLERWNQEMSIHQETISKENAFQPLPVPAPNTVSSDRLMAVNGRIVLEEYTFDVTISREAQQLAEQLATLIGEYSRLRLPERLVVLSDDDFVDFVKLSTEVNARIRISHETGTVDNGALWYEENVPPETFFYSFLYIGHARGNGINGLTTANDIEQYLVKSGKFPSVFQLGGNSTLGRGMMRTIWL